MEQRPLRLGEIVDDYCPRERRITNHVVVAFVGDTIKQTRCTTCDAEHVFKGARVPSRKKKDDVAALETAVLASVNGTQLVARIDPGAASARPGPNPADPAPMAAGANDPQPAGPSSDADASAQDPDTTTRTSDEPLAGGWIGHRTLIRASLPRTEGEPPPARPIPEFTMHQRQTRGSHAFRNGNGWGGGDRQSRGFRGNGHSNGSGSGNGGEVNGNRANSNGNPSNHHNHGSGFGGHGGPGQGGRPPGQGGRRHRHGKHRRSR